jgi:antitoxin (DNA-binding transcriptional repressor) of toxin-antitoxin stability system
MKVLTMLKLRYHGGISAVIDGFDNGETAPVLISRHGRIVAKISPPDPPQAPDEPGPPRGPAATAAPAESPTSDAGGDEPPVPPGACPRCGRLAEVGE